MSGKKRAQILAVADNRHGNVGKPHMAAVDLGTTGGPAAPLRRDIRAGAGFFFMGSKAVDQIAKKSAGGVAVAFTRFCRLKLDEGIASAYAALELLFERVEFFALLVPHEFDIANRAGIVQKKEKVFKEIQILLEFTLQRAAQNCVMLQGIPQLRARLYYRGWTGFIIKTKASFIIMMLDYWIYVLGVGADRQPAVHDQLRPGNETRAVRGQE